MYSPMKFSRIWSILTFYGFIRTRVGKGGLIDEDHRTHSLSNEIIKQGRGYK